MTDYSPRTLDGLAATIREIEQRATAAGKERDRMLAKAREAAQERSDLMTQAANLREILSSADPTYYATRVSELGEPFDPNAEAGRDELIAGMRDALTFVEATPGLPFTGSGIYLDTDRARHATNEQRRAEIDRLAALLDVEVTSYTNYRNRLTLVVRRDFGAASLGGSIELDPEPEPQQPEAADQDAATAAGCAR